MHYVQCSVVAKLDGERFFKTMREAGVLPVEKEIDIIKALIGTNARYTVVEVAQILEISSSSVYRILTGRLELKKLWIPLH